MSVISITRRVAGKLQNLASGRKHQVQVKTKYEVFMVEMEDVNFHHDSAVLMPDYGTSKPVQGASEAQDRITGLAVLSACLRHALANPQQSCLVVGHTDRSGSRSYNQTLSELRAQNVHAALKGDRARWVTVCNKKHKVEDYQQILIWLTHSLGWNCDPGAKDNVLGPKTRQAVRDFQEQYNSRYNKNITVDGSVGPQTWGAFFDVYEEDLQQLVADDQTDLPGARASLAFLKCEAIGCGEDYPITADRKENYRSPIDRRVEILFFDPGEEPVLDCKSPHGACKELYGKKMYKFKPLPAKPSGPVVPTTFKAKLTFLGADHVPRDNHYRCTFELRKSDDTVVNAGDTITDPAYRLLVDDNHALRGSQTNLLGGNGDNVSRPANYRANNWIRNVRPAVAFRIEVQQLREGTQIPVPAGRFFVRWEVEDPEEDFDRVDDAMAPDRPKTWLRAFSGQFKRVSGNDASKEDDNAMRAFGGARDDGGHLRAGSILFQTPFQTQNPQPLDTVDERLARSTLVPDTDASGNPIGRSDVVFFPPPVAGDNYRFKISLVDASGNPLQLEGEQQAITTGVFTFWRKTVIDLLVTTDNVDVDYINWGMVKDCYRACFVEVVRPQTVQQYDEANWKRIVRNYFINTVGEDPAIVNDDARYDYANFFLPDLPDADEDWCWDHGEALSRIFLSEAYNDTNRGNPRNDDLQNDVPGLFVFLCKNLHDVSTALGMYLGDREFFMVTVSDGTVTFVHEMGHALYLRHALISFDRPNRVTNDLRNDNWLDHDQLDAIACAMAYSNDFFGPDGATERANNPVRWHFCAVCGLTLRHYDRVNMTQNADYRRLVYRDFQPIRVVDSAFGAIQDDKLQINNNATVEFHALSRQEPTPNNSGLQFRKDLSSMSSGRWLSSDASIADFTTYTRLIAGRERTVQGRLAGQNAGTGTITVRFEIDGQRSQEVEVDVRSP